LINNEDNLRRKSKHGIRRFSNAKESEQGQSESEDTEKEPLSDVWIFDTLMRNWFELKPGFKIQGSGAGKKIKKHFEPRLAHTAVIID